MLLFRGAGKSMCSLASSPSLQSARKTRCWGPFSVFLFNHLWLKMFFKFTRPDSQSEFHLIFSSAAHPNKTPIPAKKMPEPASTLIVCPSFPDPLQPAAKGPRSGGWLWVPIFAEKESRLLSSVFPSLSGSVYSWLVSADAPKGSRWCRLQTETKSEPTEPQLPVPSAQSQPHFLGCRLMVQ